MHYLSIVAIFKNESHIFREWLTHYIREGVDHFYLIDNGSTDGYEKEISTFVDSRLVTLVKDDTKWAQTNMYNQYFLPLKKESEWLMVCDLDEFIYARKGFDSISNYLKSLSKQVGGVKIPWKLYGSSGFQMQPESVIASFLNRARYDKKTKNEGMINSYRSLSKMIVRSESLTAFDVHFHRVQNEYRIIDSSGRKQKSREDPFCITSERILRKSALHLNHYAIQSLQWFLDTKSTRGAADTRESENVRDLTYFNNFDALSNVVVDDELSQKSAGSPTKK